MKRLFLLTLLLTFPTIAFSQTFYAKQVEAIDGNAKCIWARDRFVTIISGPCEKYKAPATFRIGETFEANGSVKTIRVIEASKIEKAMPSIGLKAGDWICSAAESRKDIPDGTSDSHTGTWLYISKCRPME